jgi:hypothetical protein
VKTKVALIGTSFSGKSTCARTLNFGLNDGDMDLGEGVGAGPCPESAAMIQWILARSVTYVAVSVHVEDDGKGLRGLRDLKRDRRDARLDQIRFIYLFATKEELKVRARVKLGKPPDAEVDGHFRGYERDDQLFRELQDDIVDVAGKTRQEVEAEVQAITSNVLPKEPISPAP